MADLAARLRRFGNWFPAGQPDAKALLDEAAYAVDRMQTALTVIAGTACDNFTTGLGSCYRNGRLPLADFTADRCCDSCIAWAVLSHNQPDSVPPSNPPAETAEPPVSKGS